MKSSLIFLAAIAVAIPLGDNVEAPGLSDASQRPSKIQDLVNRIKKVSSDIVTAPVTQDNGDAGGPQSPPGESVNEFIVSVLESVETSINGIIEYLGGGGNVDPGQLPPVNPSSETRTTTGPLHTMPRPSSGLPPRSSSGSNTTYTPPTLSSQSVQASETATFANTTTDTLPTQQSSMNETIEASLSTATVNPDTTPVPASSTFSMQPTPFNSSTSPTRSTPTLNITTLMPVPVPTASASDTLSSQTTPSAGISSALAQADEEVQSFLHWLLEFLETQLNAVGGNAGRAR